MKTDLVSKPASTSVSDRRRHHRYRFSAPIAVHISNGSAVPGISLEISESGISVLINHELTVGATVELEPIAGGRVSALVRRQTGKVYGFEFLNLSPAQVQRIVEKCKMLPLYSTKILDI